MRRLPLLPSPSKLTLAEACLFPWSIHAPAAPVDAGTSHRHFGSGISTVGEAAVNGVVLDLRELAESLGLTPADVSRFVLTAKHVVDAIDDLRTDPEVTDLRAEVSVAYTTTMTSARLCALHAPGGAAADEREGERSGALDLVYRRAGKLVVRDWKSGPRAREHRPADTVQLLAYGVAAALAFGDQAATLELAHVDESGVYVVADELGALDLDAAAIRVAGLYAASARRDGVPTPGSHCVESYCPIVSICPATVAAIEAIHDAAEAPAMVVEFDSPEHAASVRQRSRMVRAALDAIDEALKTYAKTTPIPVGNGKVYGVRMASRDSIDLAKPGAVAVLEKHLGAFGVDTAIERSTSKAAIHRAAIDVSEKGKAAALERALFAELRELGAMTTSEFPKIEEFKPTATIEETTTS